MTFAIRCFLVLLLFVLGCSTLSEDRPSGDESKVNAEEVGEVTEGAKSAETQEVAAAANEGIEERGQVIPAELDKTVADESSTEVAAGTEAKPGAETDSGLRSEKSAAGLGAEAVPLEVAKGEDAKAAMSTRKPNAKQGLEDAEDFAPPKAKPREIARGKASAELMWQIPGEPVEKYHVRYGLDPENLSNNVEVAVADLQKVDHPIHGPLFRYVIRNVPGKKSFYFTVQAENEYGLSPETPVRKVETK